MFIVNNISSAKIGRLPLETIKKTVLGEKYSLSLIFTDAKKIAKLNHIYRNKNEATDVLSFPLSPNEGEIYICPEIAKTECKKFDRTYENFIGFLFIHACVHLKGYDHSSKMESIEKKIRSKFKI